MRTSLPLHPRHGVHLPTSGSPARRPRSIRRTSAVDALWSGEVPVGVQIAGHTRDLLTHATGAAEVVAEAHMQVEAGLGARWPQIVTARTWPDVRGLDALCGRPAGSGFRAAVDECTAAVPGTGEYLLLDEVPVCTLVSRYGVMHAGARLHPSTLEVPRESRRPVHGADACAGYVTGGTLVSAMEVGAAAVPTGPEAPSLLDPADPLAWPELPPLIPDGVRRRRRIDVWRDTRDDLCVDSFYRDSHLAPSGLETVIHEYTVAAIVDGRTSTVLSCSSTARVLPFVECLPAARSAERLAGLALADLRGSVRTTFTGVTTCTHLNDQLRGLADVEHLAELLGSRG